MVAVNEQYRVHYFMYKARSTINCNFPVPQILVLLVYNTTLDNMWFIKSLLRKMFFNCYCCFYSFDFNLSVNSTLLASHCRKYSCEMFLFLTQRLMFPCTDPVLWHFVTIFSLLVSAGLLAKYHLVFGKQSESFCYFHYDPNIGSLLVKW